MKNQSINTCLETEQIVFLIQASNLRPGFWWQNMALSSKSHDMHPHLSQCELILQFSCKHRTLEHIYNFFFFLLLWTVHLHPFNAIHMFWNFYYYPSTTEHKGGLLSKLSRLGFQWDKNVNISLTILLYGFQTPGMWLDTCIDASFHFLKALDSER